ncbi:uncharacterized protein [Clytia hemisphaerica]|uniref:Uncharacterized protein n=1 Tax=Clytia hemisphaerica TaxID=252671 RepID=A0A7M5XEX4_9CNID
MFSNRSKTISGNEGKIKDKKASSKKQGGGETTIQDNNKTESSGGLLKTLRRSFRSKKGSKRKQQQQELFNNSNDTSDSHVQQDDVFTTQEHQNNQRNLQPDPLSSPSPPGSPDSSGTNEAPRTGYFKAIKGFLTEHDHQLQKNGFTVENSHTSIKQQIEVEESRHFKSEDIFKRPAGYRDEMGFLRRKSSGKEKKNSRNESESSETSKRSRSNSADSMKRKFSFKKNKKEDLTEISDAELVYSTYGSRVDHIDGTLKKKTKSEPPPEMAFYENPDSPIAASPSPQLTTAPVVSDEPIKDEDINALKDLLNAFSDSEEQFISNEEHIKVTHITKVQTSPPTSIKTPPATPKDILDNIPAWQRNLVLDDKNVAKNNKDKGAERKSEVLEDSRLLDKLLAIEKEGEFDQNNNTSVDEHGNIQQMTKIISNQTIEHVEIRQMAKAISNQSVDRQKSPVNDEAVIQIHHQEDVESALDFQALEESFEKVGVTIQTTEIHYQKKTQIVTDDDVIVPKERQDVEAGIELDESMFDGLDEEGLEANEVVAPTKITYPTVTLKRQMSKDAALVSTTIEESQPQKKQSVSIRIGGGASLKREDSQSKPIKISVRTKPVSQSSATQEDVITPVLAPSDETTPSFDGLDSERASTISNESHNFDSVGQLRLQSVQFTEEEIKSIEHKVNSLSQNKDTIEEADELNTSHDSVEKYADETSNHVLQDAYEGIEEISKTVNLNKSNVDGEAISPVTEEGLEAHPIDASSSDDEKRAAFKEVLDHEIELTKDLKAEPKLKTTETITLKISESEVELSSTVENEYDSACAEINPRVGDEIEDRERRIQRLLTLGQSGSQGEPEEEVCTMDVENVVESMPDGQLVETSGAKREELIKNLLTKMSVQQAPMTLVRDDDRVTIAYSPSLDRSREEDEISNSGTSEEYNSDHEERTQDETDAVRPVEDENVDHPDDTKVTKLAFAMMTKYRQHEVNMEIHGGLFEDVDGDEEEDNIADEERKLTKNHFFDQPSIDSDQGTGSSRSSKTNSRDSTNAVIKPASAVKRQDVELMVTASTPTPEPALGETKEEPTQEEAQLVRSDSFRRRPRLSPSESDADDLKKNIKRSIEVDDQEGKAKTEVRTQEIIMQTTTKTTKEFPSEHRVETYESSETTVQYRETYGSVNVQTTKAIKSINISSQSPSPAPVSYFDQTVEIDDETPLSIGDGTPIPIEESISQNFVAEAQSQPDFSQLEDNEPGLNQVGNNMNLQPELASKPMNIEEEVIDCMVVQDEHSAPEFNDEQFQSLDNMTTDIDEVSNNQPGNNNAFAEVLEDSQIQLLQQCVESEQHTTKFNEQYESACHDINPRLEFEVSDRDRRIRELLMRAQQSQDSRDGEEETEIQAVQSHEVCSEVPQDDLSASQRVTLTVLQKNEVDSSKTFSIPHNTYTKGEANCNGPIVSTSKKMVYPSHSNNQKPLPNPEAVTLEIQGDRLIEKDDSQKYLDANRKQQIPVKLSSVKSRRTQNITLELRSSGPLIGSKSATSSTHSIGSKTPSSSTHSIGSVTAEAPSFKVSPITLTIDHNGNEELRETGDGRISVRAKPIPTTSL